MSELTEGKYFELAGYLAEDGEKNIPSFNDVKSGEKTGDFFHMLEKTGEYRKGEEAFTAKYGLSDAMARWHANTEMGGGDLQKMAQHKAQQDENDLFRSTVALNKDTQPQTGEGSDALYNPNSFIQPTDAQKMTNYFAPYIAPDAKVERQAQAQAQQAQQAEAQGRAQGLKKAQEYAQSKGKSVENLTVDDLALNPETGEYVPYWDLPQSEKDKLASVAQSERDKLASATQRGQMHAQEFLADPKNGMNLLKAQWESTKKKAKEAYGAENKANAFVPTNVALGNASTAYYSKEDPQVFIAGYAKRANEDFIKKLGLGRVNPEEYDSYMEACRKDAYQFLVKMNMPTNNFDYFWSQFKGSNTILQLSDLLKPVAQRQLEAEGVAKFEAENTGFGTKVAKFAGIASGFTFDPAVWLMSAVGGGAGTLAVRGLATVGTAGLRGLATRGAIQTAWRVSDFVVKNNYVWRNIAHMAGSSVSLGLMGAEGSFMQQAVQNGAGNVDWGAVGSAGLHGMGSGLLFGSAGWALDPLAGTLQKSLAKITTNPKAIGAGVGLTRGVLDLGWSGGVMSAQNAIEQGVPFDQIDWASALGEGYGMATGFKLGGMITGLSKGVIQGAKRGVSAKQGVTNYLQSLGMAPSMRVFTPEERAQLREAGYGKGSPRDFNTLQEIVRDELENFQPNKQDGRKLERQRFANEASNLFFENGCVDDGLKLKVANILGAKIGANYLFPIMSAISSNQPELGEGSTYTVYDIDNIGGIYGRKTFTDLEEAKRYNEEQNKKLSNGRRAYLEDGLLGIEHANDMSRIKSAVKKRLLENGRSVYEVAEGLNNPKSIIGKEIAKMMEEEASKLAQQKKGSTLIESILKDLNGKFNGKYTEKEIQEILKSDYNKLDADKKGVYDAYLDALAEKWDGMNKGAQRLKREEFDKAKAQKALKVQTLEDIKARYKQQQKEKEDFVKSYSNRFANATDIEEIAKMAGFDLRDKDQRNAFRSVLTDATSEGGNGAISANSHLKALEKWEEKNIQPKVEDRKEVPVDKASKPAEEAKPVENSEAKPVEQAPVEEKRPLSKEEADKRIAETPIEEILKDFEGRVDDPEVISETLKEEINRIYKDKLKSADGDYIAKAEAKAEAKKWKEKREKELFELMKKKGGKRNGGTPDGDIPPFGASEEEIYQKAVDTVNKIIDGDQTGKPYFPNVQGLYEILKVLDEKIKNAQTPTEKKYWKTVKELLDGQALRVAIPIREEPKQPSITHLEPQKKKEDLEIPEKDGIFAHDEKLTQKIGENGTDKQATTGTTVEGIRQDLRGRMGGNPPDRNQGAVRPEMAESVQGNRTFVRRIEWNAGQPNSGLGQMGGTRSGGDSRGSVVADGASGYGYVLDPKIQQQVSTVAKEVETFINSKEGGKCTSQDIVVSSPEDFAKALKENTRPEVNVNGWMVDCYGADHYTNALCILTKDGKAGVAVMPDGEIVSLFSGVRGDHRSEKLMSAAIASGGCYADCYYTRNSNKYGGLPALYAKYGLKVSHSVPFDPTYVDKDLLEKWRSYQQEHHRGTEMSGVATVYLDPAVLRSTGIPYFKNAKFRISDVIKTDDYDAMKEMAQDAREKEYDEVFQEEHDAELKELIRKMSAGELAEGKAYQVQSYIEGKITAQDLFRFINSKPMTERLLGCIKKGESKIDVSTLSANSEFFKMLDRELERDGVEEEQKDRIANLLTKIDGEFSPEKAFDIFSAEIEDIKKTFGDVNRTGSSHDEKKGGDIDDDVPFYEVYDPDGYDLPVFDDFESDEPSTSKKGKESGKVLVTGLLGELKNALKQSGGIETEETRALRETIAKNASAMQSLRNAQKYIMLAQGKAKKLDLDGLAILKYKNGVIVPVYHSGDRLVNAYTGRKLRIEADGVTREKRSVLETDFDYSLGATKEVDTVYGLFEPKEMYVLDANGAFSKITVFGKPDKYGYFYTVGVGEGAKIFTEIDAKRYIPVKVKDVNLYSINSEGEFVNERTGKSVERIKIGSKSKTKYKSAKDLCDASVLVEDKTISLEDLTQFEGGLPELASKFGVSVSNLRQGMDELFAQVILEWNKNIKKNNSKLIKIAGGANTRSIIQDILAIKKVTKTNIDDKTLKDRSYEYLLKKRDKCISDLRSIIRVEMEDNPDKAKLYKKEFRAVLNSPSYNQSIELQRALKKIQELRGDNNLSFEITDNLAPDLCARIIYDATSSAVRSAEKDVRLPLFDESKPNESQPHEDIFERSEAMPEVELDKDETKKSEKREPRAFTFTNIIPVTSVPSSYKQRLEAIVKDAKLYNPKAVLDADRKTQLDNSIRKYADDIIKRGKNRKEFVQELIDEATRRYNMAVGDANDCAKTFAIKKPNGDVSKFIPYKRILAQRDEIAKRIGTLNQLLKSINLNKDEKKEKEAMYPFIKQLNEKGIINANPIYVSSALAKETIANSFLATQHADLFGGGKVTYIDNNPEAVDRFNAYKEKASSLLEEIAENKNKMQHSRVLDRPEIFKETEEVIERLNALTNRYNQGLPLERTVEEKHDYDMARLEQEKKIKSNLEAIKKQQAVVNEAAIPIKVENAVISLLKNKLANNGKYQSWLFINNTLGEKIERRNFLIQEILRNSDMLNELSGFKGKILRERKTSLQTELAGLQSLLEDIEARIEGMRNHTNTVDPVKEAVAYRGSRAFEQWKSVSNTKALFEQAKKMAEKANEEYENGLTEQEPKTAEEIYKELLIEKRKELSSAYISFEDAEKKFTGDKNEIYRNTLLEQAKKIGIPPVRFRAFLKRVEQGGALTPATIRSKAKEEKIPYTQTTLNGTKHLLQSDINALLSMVGSVESTYRKAVIKNAEDSGLTVVELGATAEGKGARQISPTGKMIELENAKTFEERAEKERGLFHGKQKHIDKANATIDKRIEKAENAIDRVNKEIVKSRDEDLPKTAEQLRGQIDELVGKIKIIDTYLKRFPEFDETNQRDELPMKHTVSKGSAPDRLMRDKTIAEVTAIHASSIQGKDAETAKELNNTLNHLWRRLTSNGDKIIGTRSTMGSYQQGGKAEGKQLKEKNRENREELQQLSKDIRTLYRRRENLRRNFGDIIDEGTTLEKKLKNATPINTRVEEINDSLNLLNRRLKDKKISEEDYNAQVVVLSADLKLLQGKYPDYFNAQEELEGLIKERDNLKKGLEKMATRYSSGAPIRNYKGRYGNSLFDTGEGSPTNRDLIWEHRNRHFSREKIGYKLLTSSQDFPFSGKMGIERLLFGDAIDILPSSARHLVTDTHLMCLVRDFLECDIPINFASNKEYSETIERAGENVRGAYNPILDKIFLLGNASDDTLFHETTHYWVDKFAHNHKQKWLQFLNSVRYVHNNISGDLDFINRYHRALTKFEKANRKGAKFNTDLEALNFACDEQFAYLATDWIQNGDFYKEQKKLSRMPIIARQLDDIMKTFWSDKLISVGDFLYKLSMKILPKTISKDSSAFAKKAYGTIYNLVNEGELRVAKKVVDATLKRVVADIYSGRLSTEAKGGSFVKQIFSTIFAGQTKNNDTNGEGNRPVDGTGEGNLENQGGETGPGSVERNLEQLLHILWGNRGEEGGESLFDTSTRRGRDMSQGGGSSSRGFEPVASGNLDAQTQREGNFSTRRGEGENSRRNQSADSWAVDRGQEESTHNIISYRTPQNTRLKLPSGLENTVVDMTMLSKLKTSRINIDIALFFSGYINKEEMECVRNASKIAELVSSGSISKEQASAYFCSRAVAIERGLKKENENIVFDANNEIDEIDAILKDPSIKLDKVTLALFGARKQNLLEKTNRALQAIDKRSSLAEGVAEIARAFADGRLGKSVEEEVKLGLYDTSAKKAKELYLSKEKDKVKLTKRFLMPILKVLYNSIPADKKDDKREFMDMYDLFDSVDSKHTAEDVLLDAIKRLSSLMHYIPKEEQKKLYAYAERFVAENSEPAENEFALFDEREPSISTDCKDTEMGVTAGNATLFLFSNLKRLAFVADEILTYFSKKLEQRTAGKHEFPYEVTDKELSLAFRAILAVNKLNKIKYNEQGEELLSEDGKITKKQLIGLTQDVVSVLGLHKRGFSNLLSGDDDVESISLYDTSTPVKKKKLPPVL